MQDQPSKWAHLVWLPLAFGGFGAYAASTGCASTNSAFADSPNLDDRAETGAPADASVVPDGGPPSGLGAKAACEAYVDAYCDRADVCYGLTGSSDALKCRSRKLACPDLLFSNGSTWTPEAALACSPQWATLACDDFRAGLTVPCSVPGTRAPGAGCAFHSQCASRKCRVAIGTSCGLCDAIAAPGGDCGHASCPPAAPVCNLSAGARCEALPSPSKAGDPCSAGTNRCRGTAAPACTLVSATSSTATCQPLPLAGGPCSYLDGAGPFQQQCVGGAQCVAASDAGLTDRGMCARLAQAGEACSSGSLGRLCAPDLYCNVDADPNHKNGTCAPGPSVRGRGAPCTAGGPGDCEVPLTCVAGQCTLPDPAQCDVLRDQ